MKNEINFYKKSTLGLLSHWGFFHQWYINNTKTTNGYFFARLEPNRVFVEEQCNI